LLDLDSLNQAKRLRAIQFGSHRR